MELKILVHGACKCDTRTDRRTDVATVALVAIAGAPMLGPHPPSKKNYQRYHLKVTSDTIVSLVKILLIGLGMTGNWNAYIRNK